MGAKPAKAISMDFMKTFGAYLRWKLVQHGMTQRTMAESLGICWRSWLGESSATESGGE